MRVCTELPHWASNMIKRVLHQLDWTKDIQEVLIYLWGKVMDKNRSEV